MPIDHSGIWVVPEKHSEVVRFYLSALAPLGYAEIMNVGDGAWIGLGVDKKPDFWVCTKPGVGEVDLHYAFSAKDRATVDAFYKAAIDAGAKDNGAPGLRTHYHPNYYAAFVRDPVGNNVEVVCHLPTEEGAPATMCGSN